MEDLSYGAQIVSLLSAHEATQLCYGTVGVEHLFLGILHASWLTEPEIEEYARFLEVHGQAFQRLKFEMRQLSAVVNNVFSTPEKFYGNFSTFIGKGTEDIKLRTMHRTEQFKEVVRIADRLARSTDSFRVQPIHLLWAIIADNKNLAYSFLCERNIDINRLMQACEEKSRLTFIEAAEKTKNESKQKASKTPFLDKFGRDVTAKAAAGEIGPVIGRENEIKAICLGLLRKDRSAVVLLGEAGVGKTCIVEGLAKAIVEDKLPALLKPKLGKMRVIEISIGSLIAGTQFRGQFEERMQGIMDEARANLDTVIVFIDEIHLMMGAGATMQNETDAANLLKPAISRREINLIGATTVNEYVRYIEKDAAVDRRLEKVYVNEPNREESLAILQGVQKSLESYYSVKIADSALSAAVDFTTRYISGQRLPAKALDALHQACASKVYTSADEVFWQDPTASPSHHTNLTVVREDIARVIAATAKIPVSRLIATPDKRAEEIRAILHSEIAGQDEAINTTCDVILRAELRLTDPNRPSGILLFLGPTGVGKTETVKCVNRALFGDDPSHFLQLDMADYSEAHQVSRLIGAPPGYVGYEQEGILTGAVRKQPYSIILFDDIDRAHPNIFQIFLQIFDEGHLMDSHGRRTDFRNTMIFLTTNFGTTAATSNLGFKANTALGGVQDKEGYRKNLSTEIKKLLRNDIINRIDNIVFFYPLDTVTIGSIADKFLKQWSSRLQTEHKVDLHLTEKAYEYIIKKGYSEVFGARELRNVIQHSVISSVSQFLSHEKCNTGDILVVDVDDDGNMTVKRSQ